jgi:hypothetical protein
MGRVCVTSDGSRKRGWGVGVGNSILLVALGVCTLGYSEFHDLKGFTRKKMPNNIL